MKKILIVDDQPEVRELVAVTLRAGTYHILEAESGERALAVAKEHKPDIILMDVMMAGKIDGFEATRRLKSDPETKDCTIIMLTAKGQAADRDTGFEAGADDYFVKPFSPLELLRKIEEVLEK
jgi:two-component system phosphate regulon response regulator PhoB